MGTPHYSRSQAKRIRKANTGARAWVGALWGKQTALDEPATTTRNLVNERQQLAPVMQARSGNFA